MIEQLMALGFTQKAAEKLAQEIAEGKTTLDKVTFTAQVDLRFVPKKNAEAEGN